MSYRTVFDVAASGYRDGDFPLHGAIFIAIGIVMVVGRRRLPGWWGRHPRASTAFASFFLGFAVLWTLVAGVSTWREYARLVDASRSAEARVVEGPVSEFRPMPASGHAQEHFCVAEACFDYSDFIVTAAFNNTSSHGGPIHEGLPVRVTYVGNAIVKLEVKQ